MKLKIEGKLKDGFFEWYVEAERIRNNEHHTHTIFNAKKWFDRKRQSEQFGLLQEYADTLGIYVKASKSLDGYSCQAAITLKYFQSFRSATLQEAQVAAIEKLNEIVNRLLGSMQGEEELN